MLSCAPFQYLHCLPNKISSRIHLKIKGRQYVKWQEAKLKKRPFLGVLEPSNFALIINGKRLHNNEWIFKVRPRCMLRPVQFTCPMSRTTKKRWPTDLYSYRGQNDTTHKGPIYEFYWVNWLKYTLIELYERNMAQIHTRNATCWKVHPSHLIARSIDQIYYVGHLPSPKLYRLPAKTFT